MPDPDHGENMQLRIVPITLKAANEFVKRLHRHSRPVVGYKFAVGVEDETGTLRGVAIVGRPVAQKLDDGKAAEITRLCTDGARNACSMLYGAARKAARALGHEPVITYTLPEEGGPACEPLVFGLIRKMRVEALRCGTTAKGAPRNQSATTSLGESGDGLGEA